MGKCSSKVGATYQPAASEASSWQKSSMGSTRHSLETGSTTPQKTGSPACESSLESMQSMDSILQEQGRPSNATTVIENAHSISHHYHIDLKPLQMGSHGPVFKGQHLMSGKVRAIKSIAKTNTSDARYAMREVVIMKRLDHPNIVKLFETYQDSETLHLVTELCTGGHIVEHIVKAGRFSEFEASLVMQQLLHAVNYMHSNARICHRDLKTDCIALGSNLAIGKNAVKLTDFGSAKMLQKGQLMSSKLGSAHFMSPQVLAGSYDESCDVWSIGVIMYILLCGSPPFDGQSDFEVCDRVVKGDLSFDSSTWCNVSEDGKQLIAMLLQKCPHGRYSADQALNHPWVKCQAPKAADFSVHESFIDHLRSFGAASQLKKAVLRIIVGELAEKDIKASRDMFRAFDVNGDGLITMEELKEGIVQAGVRDLPADFVDIVSSIDSQKSGGIDYTEFLAASLKKDQYLKESACRKAFNVFDRNGDGRISCNELSQVLNSGSFKDENGSVAQNDVAQLIKEFGLKNHGQLDFEEFMLMMLRGCSPRPDDFQL
mmetsp:Transcript_74130/g.116024  ORF Transcript_74130/g.116024 Transcript_74130/m.116024 type:complete len:544 (+) Transcript_74130:52-1683(+)